MAKWKSTTPGLAVRSRASAAADSSKAVGPYRSSSPSRNESGFAGLQEAGFDHVPLKQPLRSAFRKGARSVVPLADIAIGNLQQWLIGTYHGVSRAQLQPYLDEFVFRHNRRKQPMAAFQTLLGLGSSRAPTPYSRIRGGRDMLKLLEEP